MTRLDLQALRAWNLRNARARADYYANPTPAPKVATTDCHGCGKPTQSKYGTCAKCVGRKDR